MSSFKTRLGGIYRIDLSDTHFYVGRSSDIERRAQTHLRRLRQGKHENTYMQRVFSQYQQFRWVMLLPCEVLVDAVEAEQTLLDRLIGTAGCLNLNRSAFSGPGMVGKRHTEDSKRKIREARSQQTFSDVTRQKLSSARMGNNNAKGHSHPQSDAVRQKISNSRIGMTFSDTHRQAISESRKGSLASEETRKRMSESMKAHWDKVRQGTVTHSRINLVTTGVSK